MISKYLVSDLRGYLTLLKARYGEILTYPRRIVNSANRITLFCHITLAPIDTRKILGYSYGLKIIWHIVHSKHTSPIQLKQRSTPALPLRRNRYASMHIWIYHPSRSFNYVLYSLYRNRRYRSDSFCLLPYINPFTTNLCSSSKFTRKTYTTKKLESEVVEKQSNIGWLKTNLNDISAYNKFLKKLIASGSDSPFDIIMFLNLNLSHFVQILGLMLRSVRNFIKYGEGI